MSDLSDDLSELHLSHSDSSDLEDELYSPVLKYKDNAYENKPELENVYNRAFFEEFPYFSDESLSALILLAC